MRVTVFLLALFLFYFVVQAQWDDDDPDDPDEDPDDDPPWRPTPTRRPTPTKRPTPTPDPEEPEIPDDPPEPTPTGVNSFANATVYQPDDSSHHLTSPRTEILPNNTILVVWNDPEQANSTIPIYRSTNDGFSWYAHGTVKSTVAGRKLLEPHLAYVEGEWSNEENITLLAVNAVDAKSTNIELYASWDKGETFEFVHRVAEGGPVGAKAVGEPFLLLHEKRLTVYYSDQRDGQHAQKISQQSTADMWEAWGKTTEIAASNVVADSFGVSSVAKLPNKQYIIAFESSQNSSSTVQFKLFTNPESPGTERAQDIVTAKGPRPQGAPFVTWTSIGGANGTIVISGSNSNSVFINQALGLGPWKEVATTAGRAYAREVKAVPNDIRALRLVGGSEGKTVSSDVLVTIMDFEKALAAVR